MHPAHTAQTFRKKNEAMLQISLTPAAFALRVFNQCLRGFFVAAFQIVSEPDSPIFAEHQRGLDKIVRQNLSAEGFASGQRRQIAKLHERLGADDGVVTPIISEVERPIIQAGNKNRRVETIGKLLNAAKQRLGIHERGHGLNQTGGRMRFHQFHQVHERFAAHHAVGITANKVAVAHPPSIEKVADVAALARFIEQAAAIINFSERIKVAHEFGPTRFFLDPAVGIGRVA